MLCWVQFLLNHVGICLDVQHLTNTHVQPNAKSCPCPVTTRQKSDIARKPGYNVFMRNQRGLAGSGQLLPVTGKVTCKTSGGEESITNLVFYLLLFLLLI